MKQFLLAVVLSTTTIPVGGSVWWFIGGPVDVSSQAVVSSTRPVVTSTQTVPVILKSATTNDCYRLTVAPNGTLGTVWVPCQ